MEVVEEKEVVEEEEKEVVEEKRVGFKLAQKDVFLNIAGGLKVNDPAIDLAVISAILSSNMDAEIESGCVWLEKWD